MGIKTWISLNKIKKAYESIKSQQNAINLYVHIGNQTSMHKRNTYMIKSILLGSNKYGYG
jgi:hypothetical protein